VNFSMMIDADFPMYLMVDEESADALIGAEEVDDFFVDPEKEPTDVVFLRVHWVGESKRRTESAVLEIVTQQREKVGEYFIGRAVLGDAGAESPDGKISSVAYRFFGNRCEYLEAAKIWRRWASGVAIAEGEWLQWPVSQHDAWLHVVQNSWFTSNHRAARYGDNEVAHLDGTHIATKAGFFCALGEAVNGPGGYFGSNLDAMADCISSSLDVRPLVKIVWQNFRISQELLDRVFLDSVMEVMEVMEEFHVDVDLC
jgi:RNAse (barnase) inhibitor barstar